MSRKNKFANSEGLYFVSFATVYWVDVFVRPEYCSIILDSLLHCIQTKGMKLYCWCIMPSHVHMIFNAAQSNPSELLGRFKEFTSKAIRKEIEHHPSESRREWLLWMMERAAASNSSVTKFQFWQHHNKPIELWSPNVIEQKVRYIHDNPVKAGFVDQAEDWRYSSAKAYCGQHSIIPIELLN